MPDITLQSITKSYGALTPIRDLSFVIPDGEFVVLVGPSGCGKSTLLRMIAGLEDITAGTLLVAGERFNDIPPQRRNVAMVFQSYALFPHMNVRENIAFGPQIRQEADVAARVDEAAALLNLTPVLDKKPAQLSGGQRQRVAMGRAIVRDAKVFLFDEPLSNLDAKLRVQMRTEIKALHQKLKPTIVYVTHDQTEAMTMADRIIVMNAGSIEQIGTPMELYDNPKNRFVANFIGAPSMELVAGVFERNAAGQGVRLADGALVPVLPCDCQSGQKVEIGVRPENFVLSDAGDVTLHVEVVEPTGPETHVFGAVAGHPMRIALRDRRKISVGDALRLEARPDHVLVFDPVTGQRIV